MAQEFSDGQQPIGAGDFETEVALRQSRVDGFSVQLETRVEEVGGFQKGIEELRKFVHGERAALRNLCKQQAEVMNPRFKAGEVPVPDMIRQAFVIARGMCNEREAEQLIVEEAAAERILPLLQEAGTPYALFGYDGLIFCTSEGPAYLRAGGSVFVGGNVHMEIPKKPSKYGDAIETDPSMVEVEPTAILERYKEYQKSKLEGAAKQREEHGGRRYSNEQTPIECAKVGRAMSSQTVVELDEEAQALVRASQEPLRQYLDDMLPELVQPGRFSAGDSDTRTFLYAIDEARHLNGDKIREMIETLVDTVRTADMGGYTGGMIDLIALITEHAEHGPDKKGSELDMIDRHARAVCEAVAMVKAATKGD